MLVGLAAGVVLAVAEYFVLQMTGLPLWWMLLLPLAGACAGLAVEYRRMRRRLVAVERQRDEAASELERRISEIFSLRELGYVLSESLHQERIVEQVARYAARFLQSEGVMVVLVEEGNRFVVGAAEGTLAGAAGRSVPAVDVSLVTAAIERGRIEVDQERAGVRVRVLGDLKARNAAVVPLTVRGERIGALAVVDRRGGTFTTEDLWLLSAVATNASVVLANSRLFALAERGRAEWETAFDALREGLALLDGEGRVQRANSALAALGGTTPAQLIGTDAASRLFGSAPPARALLRDAHAGHAPASVVIGDEEAGRLLRLTAAPVGGTFGARAVVLLVEDVTEQRALESQVIQSEKMAAIGQLVSGVAHELNNPLTSIAGLSELLLDQGMLPEAAREHLRIIHDQSERAGRIVRNLLTFARRGEPQKVLVDLNEIAGRTAQLVSYELRLRDVTLESSLAAGPVLVMGDPYELQQVLLNLLTNAIQALSDVAPAAGRRIALSSGLRAGQAFVTVADNGPGVASTHVPRLFTPFFTTKPAGQGTGLGLPLSYGIAKSHGGTLAYAAADDGGAMFTLAIPAAASPAARRSTRRILVVEQDPAAQRMISALFAPEGHAVDVAAAGSIALELAGDRDYDLVIADPAVPLDDDQLFVPALQRQRPEWEGRIVTVAKPLDVRQLRSTVDALMR